MTDAKKIRPILIHGQIMILTGLLWGLVVPHTPYPRLALGAHIQFVGGGLMFVIIAILLLTIPNSVGQKSLYVLLASVWLTWAMAISEAANAWWGTTQMLPIAAHQAGATGAAPWQENIVKLTHISAGLVLIIAWALLIAGYLRKSPPGNS
jgi:(hydroxyamino)benzene mutase